MACNSNDTKVDELKNDFLTCPLCLQVFNQPKVLSCQHTFCLACLQGYLAHNKFLFGHCVCPLCKETVPVPDGDARKLQNNFLITGLVQFVREGGSSKNKAGGANGSLPSEPPSEECPLCEETRGCTEYCLQCQLWLCASCKRSHLKVPATRDHSLKSVQDLYDNSLQQLKTIEQLMHGLVDETDTRQAEIFHQRQMLSDQMSHATCAINVTTARLVAMVEAMQEKLLSQLYSKLTDADDYLSKSLGEVEGRRGQLDRLRDRVKDARRSSDLGEGMRLVNDLQRDLRQLTPLPVVPPEGRVVSFHPAPLLLSSLEADSMGHLTTCEEAATAQSLRFPSGEDHLGFSAVPDVEHSLEAGLISGFVAYGSLPERLIFVAGNNGVFCCPPRLEFGLPKFKFADAMLFHKPWGVALTADEHVLVSDAGARPGDGFVAICDLDGNFVTFLARGLSLPRGLAVGNDGLVYVCDQDDRCVYILDYSNKGAMKKVLKKDADGKFFFLSPMDVAVAANGDIIVSDAGQFVKIFARNFTLRKVYQSPFPQSELWGVCTHPSGRVYVADWKHGIQVLSNCCEARFEGLLTGVDAAGIVEPTAVGFSHDTESFLIGNSGCKIFQSQCM